MCFDIDGSSLDKYFPQFREDFKTDSDKYYVIVTEHYFKMMTLQQYLDENINSLTDKSFPLKFLQNLIKYMDYLINEKFLNILSENLYV